MKRFCFTAFVLSFVCMISYAGVPHKEMLDAQMKKIPKGSSILFLTDTHWNSNAGHSTEQMKYVSGQTGIGTVVFAGDSYDHADNKEDALRQLSLYTDLCISAFGDDFHYIIGNHDANSWPVGKGYATEEVALIPDTLIYKVTQSHIADKAVYDQVGIKAVQNHPFESESQRKEAMAWMKMHWYRDLPTEKIRLIALETGNRGYTARTFANNAESLFLAQTDFVAKALMSLPEGYNAVIVGHQMGFYKGEKKLGTQIAGLMQMMQVVSAYGTSSKVTVSPKNVPLKRHPLMKTFWKEAQVHDYDFTSIAKPGKVILLGGHFHQDMFWLASPSEDGMKVEPVDPLKLKTVKKGQVLCFWVNRDVCRGGKNPAMKKGTPTEQSFMALTFGKNNVVMTRFGAGNDYKITLK